MSIFDHRVLSTRILTHLGLALISLLCLTASSFAWQTFDDLLLNLSLVLSVGAALGWLFSQILSATRTKSTSESFLIAPYTLQQYQKLTHLTDFYVYYGRVNPQEFRFVPEWQLGDVVQLTGYSAKQLFEHSALWWQDIVHPDDQEHVSQQLLQHMTQFTPFTLEYRILDPQGRLIWLQDHITPIGNPQQTQHPTHFLGVLKNVTEQRQQWHILQRDEQRYRSIIETAEEGIWLVNTEGYTTFVNQRMVDMLGYDDAELLSGRFCDHVSPNYQEEVRQSFIQTIKQSNASIKSHALCFQQQNGLPLWGMLNITRLVNEQEHCTELLIMVSNLEPHKKIESALQAQEKAFEVLSESLPVGVLIVRAEQILYANKASADLFNYQVNDLMQRNIGDFFEIQLIRSCSNQLYANLNAPTFSPCHEFRILNRQGQSRWIEACFTRFDAYDHPDILITLTNVHERRQTEDALRMVAHGSASLTGTHFLDSLVVFLAEVLHLDCVFIAELIPQMPQQAMITYISHHPKNFNYLSYNVLTNESCRQILRHQHMHLITENARRQFPDDNLLLRLNVESFAAMPLLRTNGEPLGFIMLTSTHILQHLAKITALLQVFTIRISAELERIQALEALQQEQASLAQRVAERTHDLELANTELARASRMKDEFMATMSHELRTPLNAVLGVSEVLEDEIYGELTPRQLEAVRKIRDSGEHLLELINDILDLAKLETGFLELNIAPTLLHPIIETCVRLIRKFVNEKNLNLIVNYDTQVQYILLDGARFKQVLMNLLSNAVKFTPEGGTIKIATQAEADYIEIRISDTGIGIVKAEIPRLFKPFEQLDSRLSRTHSGTGLGLALVYRLVKLHGGSISVDTQLGKGSTFTVTLPISDELDQTETGTSPLKLVSKSERHILIAEDNPYNVESLQDYLQSKQYKVSVAWDGQTLFKLATEQHPDLIIMDIQMPLMEELSVLKQIRNAQEIGETPIIILTALVMQGDKERCLMAGANQYFSKPVRYQQLLSSIEYLLAHTADRKN